MYRLFTKNVNENELVWHRDKKDRVVYVLYGNEWYIQYENALPIKLIKNKKYFIPKETYHRVLKGKTNLLIKIKEC